MKKTIITLIMITALLASLTITAFAKELDLPTEGDSMQQGGSMPEWITSGTDDKTVPLEWWMLKESTGIVIEMPEDPEWWVWIIFGGWQGWSWGDGQNDSVTYTFEDGKLTALWADNGVDFSGLSNEQHAVKILTGQWNEDWGDHGVTRVYLLGVDGTEPNPSPAEPDEPDEPEPTPDPTPEPTPAPTPTPEPVIDEIKDDLEGKFLGLDVWVWIVIAVGVVAIVVVAVVVAKKKK